MTHTPFELFISGSYTSEEVEKLEDRIAEALEDFEGQLHSPQTGNTVQLEVKDWLKDR